MHKAFDFDGVIAETGITLSMIASKKFKTKITQDDLYLHGLEHQFCIPKDEAEEMIALLCSFEWTMATPVCKNAREVLRKLYKQTGYPITIVTARENISVVEYYIKVNVEVPVNVYFQPHGKKSETLKKLEVDLFVEDYLQNAIEIANAGIIPVIYLRPWNRYCFTERSMLNRISHMVNNWNEIGKLFCLHQI